MLKVLETLARLGLRLGAVRLRRLRSRSRSELAPPNVVTPQKPPATKPPHPAATASGGRTTPRQARGRAPIDVLDNPRLTLDKPDRRRVRPLQHGRFQPQPVVGKDRPHNASGERIPQRGQRDTRRRTDHHEQQQRRRAAAPPALLDLAVEAATAAAVSNDEQPKADQSRRQARPRAADTRPKRRRRRPPYADQRERDRGGAAERRTPRHDGWTHVAASGVELSYVIGFGFSGNGLDSTGQGSET